MILLWSLRVDKDVACCQRVSNGQYVRAILFCGVCERGSPLPHNLDSLSPSKLKCVCLLNASPWVVELVELDVLVLEMISVLGGFV